MEGEMFAEETETHDIQKIQQDGDGIGDDVDDVDEGLQLIFIDDARGKTIENDGQDVDTEDDG